MTGMIRRAGVVLATGVAGAVAVDGIQWLARKGAARRGAVVVASWGLRGRKSAEARAESAWLATADILSEARERIGEQAPPPTADANGAAAHDHDD